VKVKLVKTTYFRTQVQALDSQRKGSNAASLRSLVKVTGRTSDSAKILCHLTHPTFAYQEEITDEKRAKPDSAENGR